MYISEKLYPAVPSRLLLKKKLISWKKMLIGMYNTNYIILKESKSAKYSIQLNDEYYMMCVEMSKRKGRKRTEAFCESHSFTTTVNKLGSFMIIMLVILIYEPPHGKTNNLHRRKQRRRSASR